MQATTRPEPFAWWTALGVGLAATAVSLAFFLGFDEPFSLRGDNKLVHFPMKLEAWRQWSAGGLPQWSSGLWLGFGLLGDATTGIYYLPHAPAFLLTPAPHLRAFDVATAMHLGLLVAGSVVLLRRLGCGALACAFGAAVVPLASHVLGWTAYLPGFSAIAWWPWALVAGDRVLDADARPHHVFVASLPIGLQVWAGYPETGLYAGVLAAAWIVFARAELSLRHRLQRVVGLAAASALLAGPQLVPSVYAMRETLRGTALAARGLLTIQGSWIDVIDPTVQDGALAVLDPFLGGATLLLALMAVLLRAPRSAVLASAALTAGLAALGDATPVYRILSQLPVFELFRGPHKFFLATQLSVLWLAALGLSALLGQASGRRWRVAVALLLATASLLEHAASFGAHLPRVSRGHVRAEIEVSDGLEILNEVADRILPLRDASGAPARVYTGRWVRGLGSFPMVAGLETVRGGGVALLPTSHSWLQRTTLHRAQLDALGVSAVLRKGPCPRRFAAQALIDEPRMCLRLNPSALPRYALVDRVRRAEDEASMTAAMRARRPPSEVLVLVPKEVALPSGAGPPGSAQLLHRRPAVIELEVDARGERLLLVRESFSEGWTAQVDGQPVPVHRAAGPFLAAIVPSGRHTVLLEFAQPGLAAGWALALCWLTLTLGSWLWAVRTTHGAAPEPLCSRSNR